MKLYTLLVAKLGVVPAIVLSQIFYWNQGRLRVKRKGTLWLAKSRAEMCQETGISLYQEKRAIAYLKRHGWIIVERGLFGNRITPHIQLTKKGRLLFEEMIGKKKADLLAAVADDKLESEEANPLVHGASNPVSSNTAANTTINTAVGGYAAKSKIKNSKDQSQGKTKCPSPYCAAPPPQKISAMDSQQTLAKLQSKKAALPVPAEGSVTVAKLALAWEKLVPHYHDLPVLPGGMKVKPLTLKEKGMLGLYLKAVGSADAYAIMHCAVRDWGHVALAVKESKGESVPTVPRVNYLLRHWDIAVGCLKKQQQQLSAKTNSGVKMMSEAEQKSKLLLGK